MSQSNVVTLTIRPRTQDDLASMIRRLERQNRDAAYRKEILEIIEGAESVIAHHEQVIFFGRQLLKQLDGPHDAA